MGDKAIKTILNEFAVCWAARDVERVVNLFTEDGVYSASIGPEPGVTCRGREDIKDLVQHMFRVDEGSKSKMEEPMIAGDRAAWRWEYEFADGSRAIGCDFFEFRDGKIASKDAYRKSASQADAKA